MFCLNNEKLDVRTTAIITHVSIYFFHPNSNQSELLIEILSITYHYCHYPPTKQPFPQYLCKNDNSRYNVANLWVDEHQHPGACGRPGLHVCRDVFKRTFLGATEPLLRTCKMDRARIRQQRRAVIGNNNNSNTNNGDGGGGQGLLLSSVDSIDLFTNE